MVRSVTVSRLVLWKGRRMFSLSEWSLLVRENMGGGGLSCGGLHYHKPLRRYIPLIKF